MRPKTTMPLRLRSSRGATNFQPNGQPHAEKSQTIEEEDDDNIAIEEGGYRFHSLVSQLSMRIPLDIIPEQK